MTNKSKKLGKPDKPKKSSKPQKELEILISCKKAFNKCYVPFLDDETYCQIFFGGSSSGKSYFLAQRTVLDILQSDHNYLVIRNVAKTIRNSCFNEISKAINFFKVGQYFSINKSDMVITCLLNDNQILFGGLDDPEKLKSITPKKGVITDVWIEEATETEYAAIKQLEKRLRGQAESKKRLILSFNPILQDHWIYNEFFGQWDETQTLYKSEDGQLLIFKTTYKDNRFLTDEDIYRLENEKDEYYRNVYTLGNWGILGDVIFKNWRIEDLSNLKIMVDKFYNGLDFGWSPDPAAGVRVYYDKPRKTLYVLDELYEWGLTNDKLAEKIKNMIGQNESIVCDSAEPKSIAELNAHGVKAIAAIKGKDSIQHGIQWLQQQEIVIDRHCQYTINEFRTYHRKKDKQGNTLPEPEHKNSHVIDAFRYTMECESLQQFTGSFKDYESFNKSSFMKPLFLQDYD